MGLGLLFRRPLLSCPHYRLVRRAIFARLAHTDTMSTVNKTSHPFDKTRLEALLNRRFFYAPAFEIYGGVFSVSSCYQTT